MKLTAREQRAVSDLKQLAKRWPKTLWLFSASGTLCVMRTGPDGSHVMTSKRGFDPEYIVAQVGIPNDGGDW